MANIASRLKLLRAEMSSLNIDMYLVPSIDEHNSEYVPECWQRRPWISGFDGSAGEVLVTLEHAYLSTDGRYFLQAEQQLDSQQYSLLKQNGLVAQTEHWLKENAAGKRLGIDARLVSIARAVQLSSIMKAVNGQIVMIEDSLIDICKLKLGENLSQPISPAFELPLAYTGETLAERLAWLRDEMKEQEADYIALNVLDEIAWLFNIRGADIDFNPLVISYAIVGLSEAWLFVDYAKVTANLAQHLKSSAVHIVNYVVFGDQLAALNARVWLDDKTASFWMLSRVEQTSRPVLARSPLVQRKACKNPVEAAGSRLAHIKDAQAVISFLCWLDNNWQHGVDELSAADKLAAFRLEQTNIMGASFSTISGFASNGAIIHYRASPATNKLIDDSNLYLIDSGGQYLEGTTDITRTVHLGEPSELHKRHYTLVLKGHLALARAIFSQGTCGEHLDALARLPLWSEYLNYRHGTGHGVGSFLCVHEGPQKISQAATGVPLVPGMIVSNEPGLYINGSHGIRIENLCLVQEVANPQAQASEFGPFYCFEDLTLVPYAKKLIAVELLSPQDKASISSYYQQIRVKVRPNLAGAELAWLDDQLDLFVAESTC